MSLSLSISFKFANFLRLRYSIHFNFVTSHHCINTLAKVDQFYCWFWHNFSYFHPISKEQDTDTQSATHEGSQTGTSSFSDSGRGSQGSQASETVTEEMMEKIRKQSGAAIEIFGQELVRYFCVKSNCLWRESNFLASARQLIALCICVCWIICAYGLRIKITRSHMHTMQQAHTHKAVTGCAEANKLLSRRRQSDYSKQHWTLSYDFFFCAFAKYAKSNSHDSSQISYKGATCRLLKLQ